MAINHSGETLVFNQYEDSISAPKTRHKTATTITTATTKLMSLNIPKNIGSYRNKSLILIAYIFIHLILFITNKCQRTYSVTLVALADSSLSEISNPLSTDDGISSEVGSCEACRLVVDSFERGLEETSRGKHEGGDTSWEERNLKSYADSEVRLVEIQENLCDHVKKGKAQCLAVAEDSELDIEEWWFKQRNKNVRLHDYLCILKRKVCCPKNNFGPNCQPCKSECNNHGTCDGSGTRSGSGNCNCDLGYAGEYCDECSSDHFRIGTSEDTFTCRKCHHACKGCNGLGQNNCTECAQGYHKHETNGCIDINECDLGVDAKGATKLCGKNRYCVNTEGAYRCSDCHVACSGCFGYGPNMCISCAPGYHLDIDYTCRSDAQKEEMEEWYTHESIRQGRGTAARYFFYVGVLGVSVMMFRSNLYVMYSFIIGFIVVLTLSEFNLLDEPEDNSKFSPK